MPSSQTVYIVSQDLIAQLQAQIAQLQLNQNPSN